MPSAKKLPTFRDSLQCLSLQPNNPSSGIPDYFGRIPFLFSNLLELTAEPTDVSCSSILHTIFYFSKQEKRPVCYN